MVVDLETTNWLLGVLAVASAVQTLILIGVGIAGYRLYRQLSQTAAELEVRHIAPVRQQLDGILSDVHRITARVSEQTERVDHAISGTIDRVDETAERVKYSVREQMARATGILRGIRAVITSLLTTEPVAKSHAEAGGRL
jgi:predicted P-loop ATPase/GTPase